LASYPLIVRSGAPRALVSGRERECVTVNILDPIAGRGQCARGAITNNLLLGSKMLFLEVGEPRDEAG